MVAAFEPWKRKCQYQLLMAARAFTHPFSALFLEALTLELPCDRSQSCTIRRVHETVQANRDESILAVYLVENGEAALGYLRSDTSAEC